MVMDMYRGEAAYRSLAQNLDQCVFLLDLGGHCLAANPRCCDWLGLAEEEMLGQHARTIWSAESAEDLLNDLRQVQQGNRIQRECCWLRRGEEPRTVRLDGVPVRDSGGPVLGMLLLFQDLSGEEDLHHQRRVQNRIELLGQLTRGVAHDFSNRLAVIVGSLQLLLSGDPSMKQELVSNMEMSMNQVRELCQQLLTLSRPNRSDNRIVDVNVVVEEVAILLRRTCRSPIRIQFQPYPEQCLVQGDPDLLRQLVMNLALNGCDAMPQGGDLTLGTQVVPTDQTPIEADSGRAVRVSVQDTGLGMPPDIQNRIFEPYFSTKPAHQNRGLGLSIVQEVAVQHRGQVSCSSTPGAGTRFEVFLPYCSAGPDLP